jgi:protein TonB
MTADGFLEQRTARPVSLGAVILLHGAAIAGVLMIKGTDWVRVVTPPTEVINVELPPPPPPVEVPPPPTGKPMPQVPTRSFIDVPPRVIAAPVPNIPLSGERTLVPPGPVIGTNPEPAVAIRQEERLVTVPPRLPVREPVRVEAQFDPRFAGALQPPYPAAEQRNEREGEVRVRVTIGPDGRVTAVERVSATSDAFWRATQAQALSRWRFKPATVDGRPVESSKVLSVRFRLNEA